MATLTAQNRNGVTLSNLSRNNVTFSAGDNVGKLSYLTTDTPDFILVGATETDYLILWGDFTMTAETRN